MPDKEQTEILEAGIKVVDLIYTYLSKLENWIIPVVPGR